MRNNLRRPGGSSYWAGFFTAVILFATLSGGGLYLLLSRGITVSLDSAEVARMVREQVVVQARQDLPALIEGAKAEIPKVVEQEMRDQLTSDRMEIAGFVFRVPEELMAQLKQNMQQNVENATAEILDGIDTAILAEQFGQDVYRMVRETMQGELHGHSFKIMVFDRLPVRIKINIL